MASPYRNHELKLPDAILLEGIVTTINADQSTNISPMGPLVAETFDRLMLMPYQSSTTYVNLKRTGEGVFHISDDVELLARAAVGRPHPLPEMYAAEAVTGNILANACRWYAFRVESLDDRQERTKITASVVDRGNIRDFVGFNRAKHAVVEAAILATRIDFLPADKILSEFERLSVPVEKTASHQERRAFQFLWNHVRDQLANPRPIAEVATK